MGHHNLSKLIVQFEFTRILSFGILFSLVCLLITTKCMLRFFSMCGDNEQSVTKVLKKQVYQLHYFTITNYEMYTQSQESKYKFHVPTFSPLRVASFLVKFKNLCPNRSQPNTQASEQLFNYRPCLFLINYLDMELVLYYNLLHIAFSYESNILVKESQLSKDRSRILTPILSTLVATTNNLLLASPSCFQESLEV